MEEERDPAEGKTSRDEMSPWEEESSTPVTAVEGGGEEAREKHDERKETPLVEGNLVTTGMGGGEGT